MNLHGIVSNAISAVNPFVMGGLQISVGSTTSDDGVRVPKYGPILHAPMQVQPLQFRDLQQLEGLNLQGTQRKIYVQGKVDGIERVSAKGGDLITFPPGPSWPYGTVWLTTLVLEQWPDWVSLAVTLQNGS